MQGLQILLVCPHDLSSSYQGSETDDVHNMYKEHKCLRDTSMMMSLAHTLDLRRSGDFSNLGLSLHLEESKQENETVHNNISSL